MNIKVTDMGYMLADRYPYMFRVEVSGEIMDSVEIAQWLEENKIPHTQTGWGVYYMNKQNATWLSLRWA